MYKPFTRSNYATLMAAGLRWFTLAKLLFWVGKKKQLKTTNLVSKPAQKKINTQARIISLKSLLLNEMLFLTEMYKCTGMVSKCVTLTNILLHLKTSSHLFKKSTDK